MKEDVGVNVLIVTLDPGLNLPAGCVSYLDLAGTNRDSCAGKKEHR